MNLYVCMGCGYEWESDTDVYCCPKCKVGDIYCDTEEDSNDNQEQRIKENAKGEGQTIYINDVCK